MRRMSVGQIVDFCIAYNERERNAEKAAEVNEKKEKSRKRKATQKDINAFFG